MQPIILEPLDYISAIMKDLWIKQSEKDFSPVRGDISLKNDVIFSHIADNINLDRRVTLLDIGYSNRSLHDYLMKSKKNVNYMGADLIYHENNEFSTVAAEVDYLPFKNKSFDIVNLSMLLLNTIDPSNALIESSRVLKENGKLLITDINSKYYKACGVYLKTQDWEFIKIIDTNNIFFTMKLLGRQRKFLHAHHHFNLYSNFLIENGFVISQDIELGITKELISSHAINQERAIKAFSKDLKYPSFHCITGIKTI
jgi:SAM-dependent methyltransferase